MNDDFLDSYAPFDDEIITADWPLPPVREWKPKPSIWQRFKVWLIGVTEEE